jgi:transposase InsO family protein
MFVRIRRLRQGGRPISYISWYNGKRIRISLNSLSPIEYRQSLRLTA